MALKNILHCDYLTGGVDSTYLDYTDGNSLSNKDKAFVTNSGILYVYELNATSGAAESSPNVISPDTNAGTKRWILISIVPVNPPTNLLTNSLFMAWSGSTLENVGSNLTTNYNFDSGDTGWTKETGWTIVDQGAGDYKAVATNCAAEYNLYQTVSGLTVGKLYKVSAVCSDFTDGSVTVNLTAGISYLGNILTGTGTASVVFEATATFHTIYVNNKSAGSDYKISSVTLYEVTPGYVAADGLAPDTMSKTSTLDLHQYWNAASANTYGYGTYNLKATKGADGAEYLNFGTAINYRDCQGKAVALGCYVYSLTAADNVKLSIHDGVSEIALSADFVAANTLTWCEVTGTVAANATALTPRILCTGDAADVCYISEPIFVRGQSIGAGNYQPIPNEVIWLQSNIALSVTTTPATPVQSLNLEASSSGVVGKGAKGIMGIMSGKNTAAGKYIYPRGRSLAYNILYSQVANLTCGINLNLGCDANGDFDLRVEDANWSELSVTLNAIQT